MRTGKFEGIFTQGDDGSVRDRLWWIRVIPSKVGEISMLVLQVCSVVSMSVLMTIFLPSNVVSLSRIPYRTRMGV